MKKVNVILIAFVFLFSTTILSASVNPVDSKDSTSAEISKLLQDPGFVLEVETTAIVTFIVNNENEIVVLSVDSENELVERFIKQRLNYKKLETSAKQGKEYVVPVRMISNL